MSEHYDVYYATLHQVLSELLEVPDARMEKFAKDNERIVELGMDSLDVVEFGLGVEDLSVLATGLINDLDLDVDPDDLEVAFEDAHFYGGGLRIASIKEAIDSLTDI